MELSKMKKRTCVNPEDVDTLVGAGFDFLESLHLMGTSFSDLPAKMRSALGLSEYDLAETPNTRLQ